VKPLAGSESMALMVERVREREQRRSRQLMSSELGRSRELPDGMSRSTSVPSLSLARRSTGSAPDILEDSAREMCGSEASSSEADLEMGGGSCAGSALAKVRSARRNSLGRRSACGGA
jgi:hypothetical protein